MQVYHSAQKQPKTAYDPHGSIRGNVKYSVISIFFKVNATVQLTLEQESIIKEFFNDLYWIEQSKDPLVTEVHIGSLLMSLDFSKRWVYKGSMTTPPCEQYVYWNILQTVYPVSERILNQFKQQMSRTEGLSYTGNYRDIQEETSVHGPKSIQSTRDLTIIYQIIIVLLIIIIFLMCCKMWQLRKAKLKIKSFVESDIGLNTAGVATSGGQMELLQSNVFNLEKAVEREI